MLYWPGPGLSRRVKYLVLAYAPTNAGRVILMAIGEKPPTGTSLESSAPMSRTTLFRSAAATNTRTLLPMLSMQIF